MRTPLVAGNWKMNLDRQGASALASAVRLHAEGVPSVEVCLYPSFVYLEEIARRCAGSQVRVGAQDVCDQEVGAFTGEVSAAMIRDVGGHSTLVGHSERRHVYGESDALCAAKVRRALSAGLSVCLCVGETREEREAGQTEAVCRRQLLSALEGLSVDDASRITLAYEPVWAIGTGLTATPQQAGAVHTYLRGLLAGRFNQGVANATRILYGGSVKPSNAGELMAVADIDGALVGGAALSADQFLPIIDAAASQVR